MNGAAFTAFIATILAASVGGTYFVRRGRRSTWPILFGLFALAVVLCIANYYLASD
jgi:hypothetical protein